MRHREIYYNENFEKVNQWLDSDKTEMFEESENYTIYECWNDAKRLALQMRSYCYPLFKFVRYDLFHAEIKHVGYGVPK